MSESQTSSASRGYRSVIGVVALFLLALLATAGVKSFRDLKAAQDREERLEQRIAETEERIEVLREHVRRIDEDPLTLERLARENLGMVKPGTVSGGHHTPTFQADDSSVPVGMRAMSNLLLDYLKSKRPSTER